MTHKKMQKLCYYAQAWHCALYGEPLFADEIQAWIHGPVVTSLYPIYSSFKWNDIPQADRAGAELPDNAVDILSAVWDTYGDLSGEQLESLTHSEAPWRIARGDREPWENCTTPISIDDMRSYYSRKYEQAQNDQAASRRCVWSCK